MSFHPKNSQKPKGRGQVGKRLRSEIQINNDRAKIANRLAMGWELYRIAAEVGIGYDLLRYDIAQIEKKLQESAMRDLDAAQQEAINQLKHLQSVYWDAWESSVKGKKRFTEYSKAKTGRGKKNGTQIMKIVEGSTMREETYGDPRFLIGVRQCIMDIASIRGVVQNSKSNAGGDVPPVPLNGGQATYIIMPATAKPRDIPKDITPASIAAAPAPPG